MSHRFLNAIAWKSTKLIRKEIDNGTDVTKPVLCNNVWFTPLYYANLVSNLSCVLYLIDAGASPYNCEIHETIIPKMWTDFMQTRASVRSCAILAMGAMYKTYGKDVARIIGRVVWEKRGG